MELMPGSYASPRWSYELLDCSMPMTFDTYSNCSFQCVYCFSFFQRAVGNTADDYLHHHVKAVNVEAIKQMYLRELGMLSDPQQGKLKAGKSQFGWYIRARKVLQWGGLSDGFDYYERSFGKSLELLNFWNSIDYPLSISTKGVWFTEDSRYAEAFHNRGNVHMKTSIITLDAVKAKKVERGVASPEERFRMLEWMGKMGVAATTVRLRPFTLGITADYPYSDNSYKQLEAFVHRTKEAGCYSLTTEFLCLERRASNTAKERYDILGKVSGIPNLYAFYSANSLSAGLMRLNYELKRPYMEALQELCEKYDVKFFVSDAHHKEKSYHAGCCGLPETGPLSQTNKGQYAEAILIAKREGRVHWSDISPYAESLREIPFYNAEGFNTGGTDERVRRMYQTMYDYMRDQWNNPRSFMSPARYFGGALVGDQPDANGDIVYLYNKPWVNAGVQITSVKQLRDEVSQTYGADPGYIQLEKTAQQEVAELQAAVRAQQEDGGVWGHIAYDVCVNGTLCNDARLHRLLLQFKQERLNATVFVQEERLGYCETTYPDWGTDFEPLPNEPATEETYILNNEVIRQGHSMLGTPRIWLIAPRFSSLEMPTYRAALSEMEGRYAAGESALPIVATLRERLSSDYGIELVECATPDHEVTV